MLPATVVIPSVGRPQLIEALRSVLDQTQPPQEIIVCFDGPLFLGSEIEKSLRSLADDTVQFVEMRRKSGGPGKPRNVGIALSTQPFIATLDDDDSWLPEKLQVQIPVFADPVVVAAALRDVTAWARRSRRIGASVGKLRFYSARGHLQNLLRR